MASKLAEDDDLDEADMDEVDLRGYMARVQVRARVIIWRGLELEYK